MKKEERLLVKCLADFVNNRNSNEIKESEETWDHLVHLSKIHAVAGIVYQSARNVSGVPECPLKELRKQFDFAVMCALRREVDMGEVEDGFCKAGIPHIYFKGWELQKYYPIPELRMMSDVDILIRPEDREEMEKMLSEKGFLLKSRGHQCSVFVRQGLLLEVHMAFGGEPENDGDYSAWITEGFSHGIFPEDSLTGYFEPAYHFTYLCYHLAKHFHSTGAGIRMFLDLAVFWNRYKEEINFEKVWSNLEKLHLDLFCKTIFWMCNTWFESGIPMAEEPRKELLDFMTEYVFSGGVYGKHKRTTADLYVRNAVDEKHAQKKESQKMRVLIHYFFPGRRQMKAVLPLVEKHWIFLPVAWVIRWYQGLFLRKDHSIQVLKGIQKGNPDAEKEFWMLKELGLKK